MTDVKYCAMIQSTFQERGGSCLHLLHVLLSVFGRFLCVGWFGMGDMLCAGWSRVNVVRGIRELGLFW